MGGEGVEPSAFRLTTRWQRFFAGRREEHHPVIPPRVARVGVEPTGPPGLSRVALPVCVPCRRLPTSAPGGIRTRDLLADNEASAPDCSTKA